MPRDGHHIAALREHGWLIGLLIAYAAVVFAAAAALGRFPGHLTSPTSCVLFSAAMLAVALLVAAARAALGDPRRPLRAVAAWGRRWVRQQGVAALVSCLALPVLMAVFLMGKNLIPLIHPFAWDVTFADLDRTLHGGPPWALLQPLLGHPAVTKAISLVYTFWFVLLFGAWIVWSLTDHPQRMRFLLSFALCWIVLGTLAATAFSSAGPVFYAEVTGDRDGFADLMRYLHEVDRQLPLPSLAIRDQLWRAYIGNTDEIATGISAMPSLHVAIVTLCAISGWYISRLVGTLMTLFALVIFVGSVHLGWHYAVDGYASVLATAAIWLIVGRLLRWRHARAPRESEARHVPTLIELSRLQ